MLKSLIFAVFLFVVIQFVLSSCRNKTLFNSKITFQEKGWNWSDSYKDTVQITDTINTYNIFITIDLNENYQFSNLYLFVNTILPDSSELTDTINYYLANEKGKWLGKNRFGKISNKFPYKKNVRFPFQGAYIFKIEQAMRVEPLTGVKSCGIRIESYN